MPHTLFLWDTKYNINVAVLDDQHQILLEIVSFLHAHATDTTRSVVPVEIKASVETALDCLRAHFHLEEKLMRMTGYPGLEERVHVHENIIQFLTDMCGESDLRDPLNVLRVVRAMAHELFRHIVLFDKKLGLFLNRNGVE